MTIDREPLRDDLPAGIKDLDHSIHADPAQCTCSDWGNGFDTGYLAGIRQATLSEEARAEAAAAQFYRMEAHEEWLSQFVPATLSAMEVEANRRKPGSSYIPRRGDTRYSTHGTGRNAEAVYPLPEHEDHTTYSPDAPIIPGGYLDRLRQRAGVHA